MPPCYGRGGAPTRTMRDDTQERTGLIYSQIAVVHVRQINHDDEGNIVSCFYRNFWTVLHSRCLLPDGTFLQEGVTAAQNGIHAMRGSNMIAMTCSPGERRTSRKSRDLSDAVFLS